MNTVGASDSDLHDGRKGAPIALITAPVIVKETVACLAGVSASSTQFSDDQGVGVLVLSIAGILTSESAAEMVEEPAAD